MKILDAGPDDQRGRSKATLDREANTGRHWSRRQAGRVGSPVEAWVGRIGAMVPMIRWAIGPSRSSRAGSVAWICAVTECEPQTWRPMDFQDPEQQLRRPQVLLTGGARDASFQPELGRGSDERRRSGIPVWLRKVKGGTKSPHGAQAVVELPVQRLTDRLLDSTGHAYGRVLLWLEAPFAGCTQKPSARSRARLTEVMIDQVRRSRRRGGSLA